MSAVETMLIVDDDQMLLDYGSRVLTSLGYESVTTTDGTAVLPLLERDQDIRVLIIDMRLGDGPTGAELALRAMMFRHDLRVILTSGDPGSLQIAMQAMPDNVGVLPKPYRRRDLADLLSRLL